MFVFYSTLSWSYCGRVWNIIKSLYNMEYETMSGELIILKKYWKFHNRLLRIEKWSWRMKMSTLSAIWKSSKIVGDIIEEEKSILKNVLYNFVLTCLNVMWSRSGSRTHWKNLRNPCFLYHLTILRFRYSQFIIFNDQNKGYTYVDLSNLKVHKIISETFNKRVLFLVNNCSNLSCTSFRFWLHVWPIFLCVTDKWKMTGILPKTLFLTRVLCTHSNMLIRSYFHVNIYWND